MFDKHTQVSACICILITINTSNFKPIWINLESGLEEGKSDIGVHSKYEIVIGVKF